MSMWDRCAICGRVIPVGELCYGIKNWYGEPPNGDTICSDCLVPENVSTLTPPNELRVINADKLAKRIAGHSNYHGDSILAAIYCAAEGKENDVPIRPIETLPNEPLTCEGCACESYPRDCYPCNTCNRNEETLSDQYRPPEEEEGT